MGRSRSGAEHSSGHSPTGNLPALVCLVPTVRKVCSHAWASACGISNREDPGGQACLGHSPSPLGLPQPGLSSGLQL